MTRRCVDHYATLQVSRHAEGEVIDRAYRALSLKYHPDVVDERQRPGATEKMKRINAAYAVLSDPARRRAYDATLPPASSPGRAAWDVFLSKGLLGMFLERVSAPDR